MIDEAILRRFDLKIFLDKPDKNRIIEIISKTLKSNLFKIKNKKDLEKFIRECDGLSYYSIQKSLINSIKKTLLSSNFKNIKEKLIIDSEILFELINQEKAGVHQNI